MRPLLGAALLAAGGDAAGADVFEEVRRGRGGGRAGERPADVDAGVVVAAADRDAAVGVDVDRGRHVQFARARAVARLPDREELSQPAAMAALQRRCDGVEGVRQRADDAARVEVLGTRLDVAGVGLQPPVVVGRDGVAQHVDRLRLAAEAHRQLLRDEGVGQVGELERAVDRVVVGDRHEVHAAPLRELIDLVRRRRALGEPEGALDAQHRDRGGGRVAVQVDARGPSALLVRRAVLMYIRFGCKTRISVTSR